MKKLFSVLALGFLLSVMFSSCASRDHCPGVGQTQQPAEMPA